MLYSEVIAACSQIHTKHTNYKQFFISCLVLYRLSFVHYC
jgi:hypothetical protein